MTQNKAEATGTKDIRYDSFWVEGGTAQPFISSRHTAAITWKGVAAINCIDMCQLHGTYISKDTHTNYH